MLLVKKLVVLISPDLHAIWEVWVTVVLLELRVLDPEVDIALNGRHPAEHGVVVDCWVDEALANRKVRGSAVEVFPIHFMGDKRAVRRLGAVHVVPAVAALLAEVFLAICIVIRARLVHGKRRTLRCVVGDGNVEATAVKGVVALGVDHEVEALVLLDRKLVDLDLGKRFLSRADIHVLKLQELFALIDHELDAVRITGVRVTVDALHIGYGDVDIAVLRNAPLENGRDALCGVHEVLLDLQARRTRLAVLLTIKRRNPLGAMRALGVAATVEPAVLALLAEVQHVERVVRALRVVGKCRLPLRRHIEGRRPKSRQFLNPRRPRTIRSAKDAHVV